MWSGVEQRRFEEVLAPFEAATGVTVTYTPAGHAVPDVLNARLADHRPPDVAFLPQPGLLRQYAASGSILPLDADTVRVAARNFAPVWQRLATVDGHVYGIWFKAANKSLIWYNVGVFERVGVVPPADIDHLLQVEHKLKDSGVPAFSVSGADAWTLADWFANLYLNLAGAQRYELLAGHHLPWTDPSVKSTLEVMASILAPDLIAGGATTSYMTSVINTFAPAPAAAMVEGGDFVAGVVTGNTEATVGVDADAFAFPSPGPPTGLVVGGGDIAVLMRPTDAGAALLRYLATPQAATVWARAGGYISPNLNVDVSVYPDATSRSIAQALLEAGDGFHFGLADLQPAAFGGTEGAGLRKELRDFLANRDVDGTATRLEAAAQTAYRP